MTEPTSSIAAGIIVDVGAAVAGKGIVALARRAGGGLKYLTVRLWRPNGELRISMSALLRIRRNDGALALIRNRHRMEGYSPIGGCYKFYSGAGHEQLNRFGFFEENFSEDADMLFDLRGYSKRKHLGAIRSWFSNPQSARETARECLLREMKEELSEEYKVVPIDFPWDGLQFAISNSDHTFKTFTLGNRIVTQFQHFEIYNIAINKVFLDLLEIISKYKGSDLIWATPHEIAVGRSSRKNKNRPISAPAELLIKPRITSPPSMPLVADPRQSRG